MTVVIVLIGLVVGALGLVGVVRPATLLEIVRTPWRTRSGFYLAAGLRLVLGIALLSAAGGSRFPATLQVLGVLSLVGAGLIPLLGFDRLRRFVEWWLSRSASVIRAWAVLALCFGIFVVYAVV